MASGSGGKKPWYKKKFPKEHYLRKGPLQEVSVKDLVEMDGWYPLSEEEMEMWADAKSAVDQKNKKREFLLTFDDVPKKTPTGGFRLAIEILHVDYKGVIFAMEAVTEEELNKRFWPLVQKVIAHYFSPRLKSGHHGITSALLNAEAEGNGEMIP